jgi:hypothetical protein
MTERERTNSIQEGIRKWTRNAVWAAVIYAFVTVLMWWQMLRQNRIATDALRQSTESFRIDERAWIEIEPIKQTRQLGAAFEYSFFLRNVGKTAARDVQLRMTRQAPASSITMGSNAESIRGELDKFLQGKVPSFTVPIENPVPKVLAPNTSSIVPVTVFAQGPLSNGWVFYLIGRIDYTDVFGIKHWMTFCFFVADSQGTLWNCKEGNDEDKNPEIPPQANQAKVSTTRIALTKITENAVLIWRVNRTTSKNT